MTSFRWTAALLLLPAFAVSAPAQQQSGEETIYLEEVKKDFLERARKCGRIGDPPDRGTRS